MSSIFISCKSFTKTYLLKKIRLARLTFIRYSPTLSRVVVSILIFNTFRYPLTRGVPLRDVSLYAACLLYRCDPSSVVFVYGFGDALKLKLRYQH